jgi:putative hemolysin
MDVDTITSSVFAPFPWGDVAILVALIALNGVFSMSELAIVSARKARLDAITRKSQRRGAQIAIQLAADPGRFLSTVQIGITLIGIIAGAYSGASLGGPMAQRMMALGMGQGLATNLGYALVIGITTYLSLVIGELVPKQFALRAPEKIAVIMALPMLWLAKLTAPIVWLLNGSSAIIFRVLPCYR